MTSWGIVGGIDEFGYMDFIICFIWKHVFKMSKYMKTWKKTSENYKKQLPFFEKFTQPKISNTIPRDFFPHSMRHISSEAKLFLLSLSQNLDFGSFFKKWLGFVRIVSHPKTKPFVKKFTKI